MKKIYYFTTIFTILFLPQVSNAALSGIKGLLLDVKSIVGNLIPIAFGLAIVAFFFGIAKFIYEAGNPESKNKNKAIIYWGVIAIAVMASIWGIVGLLQNIFGVDKMVGNRQGPPTTDVSSNVSFPSNDTGGGGGTRDQDLSSDGGDGGDTYNDIFNTF